MAPREIGQEYNKIDVRVAFGQAYLHIVYYYCPFPLCGKGFFIIKRRMIMQEKTNKKKTIIASIILLALLLILLLVYFLSRPETVAGDKEVTVQVIIPDEEDKEYVIHTDALHLKDALDEKELIDGTDSGFGFFITTVDGRVAEDSNQEWWLITKEGEDIFVGVSEIVIEDGDKYELTLMVGY